jgi:hypothetical protein
VIEDGAYFKGGIDISKGGERKSAGGESKSAGAESKAAPKAQGASAGQKR